MCSNQINKKTKNVYTTINEVSGLKETKINKWKGNSSNNNNELSKHSSTSVALLMLRKKGVGEKINGAGEVKWEK